MYDVEAVRRLVGRYCDAVTRFDPEAFGSTWAEDAVWFIPGADDVHGRAAIVAQYSESRARYAMCVQELLSSVIEPTGWARWYVRELQWRKDGDALLGSQLIGAYDDTFGGPSAAPLFASRRFTVLYRGPVDWPGRLRGPSRLEALPRS
jgi:ketosteroid isomerase-like protein